MASLSIGKAWDEATKQLASKRRLIAPIALAFVFVPVTLAGLAAPVPAEGQAAADSIPVLAIVALLIGFMGQLAISLLATGWDANVGELLARAARRLPVLVIAGLIVALPLALLFYLAGQMLPAAGADPSTLSPGKAGGALLLLMLLLIALLLLAARMAVIVPCTAVENGGPLAMLKRSWNLTRGNFWRLLALVLLLAVASVVLLGAVEMVVGSVVQLAFGASEPWSISRLLVSLAGGLVQAVVAAVGAVMVARVYAQLTAVPATVPDVAREE